MRLIVSIFFMSLFAVVLAPEVVLQVGREREFDIELHRYVGEISEARYLALKEANAQKLHLNEFVRQNLCLEYHKKEGLWWERINKYFWHYTGVKN